MVHSTEETLRRIAVAIPDWGPLLRGLADEVEQLRRKLKTAEDQPWNAAGEAARLRAALEECPAPWGFSMIRKDAEAYDELAAEFERRQAIARAALSSPGGA
jgi:hypothetical protein